ncbi:Cullin family protein [Cryptosporidium hominis]|uniref:Cullin n=1 Tax=Cryptosporidium hominis TaxID=237895 RepID=A0ABX5BFW4_CRYHO|nr:Cullin family protein [Cryptosporidium hominis]PPS96751.1 Cullin [Cryptosporidium hominis]|eukprot:PPS96751.1 Cullin [Cryptosporidium hominis]
MSKSKYEEEWEEKFAKNIEGSKISRDISDILYDIEKSCLKPLIYFLKSIPSGFAPLPLPSLEAILEHSENEYVSSSFGVERSIESEIRNLGTNFWFDMVMSNGSGPFNSKQINSPNVFNHCLVNQLKRVSRNDDSKASDEDKEHGCENSTSNNHNDDDINQRSNQVNQEDENSQYKSKNFQIVISLQQMLHIYRIGGINNENVWTALFGAQIMDHQSNKVVIKYIMPSFLSNQILMDAYTNIIQVSEPQNNSMQIYMYCRNILKHFCTDIITPRILIHANIFLLWNSTLKDFFNNKTYDKFLSDIFNTTSDNSPKDSNNSSNNHRSSSDSVFSLYSGLLGGTLPSLLLLKVIEEEFAKFSVLTHFLIRIFGYLDRNSCHVFSNSPDLNITALLYFYKCVFFPLSSSFTAALLNIITVERDFFVQACLRSLFSPKMSDKNVFDCIKRIEDSEKEIIEMDEVDDVEEIISGSFGGCERGTSLIKCKKETHFSIDMDNIYSNLTVDKFPGESYNRVLFNVINNIILIMSNNSSNKIFLKRTNTSGIYDDYLVSRFGNTSSSSSSSYSSCFLDNKVKMTRVPNFKIEKRVTGLNRTSITIDPYRDLEENLLGLNKSCKISGLFWFPQEEIDQTVYKNTVEEPFLRGTLYYYYNRLDGLFGFLDLKQSCMLVNSILLNEEKRVVKIFPKRSHAGFFKLLESVLFYFLSRKLLESYKQSVCGIIFLNKKEMNGNDVELLDRNKNLKFCSLFKGSIRSYINNDNYCALRSIYLLFLKDTLRSNSHNILNKILLKSETCNRHKKLEFPIGNLQIDISKLSSSIGTSTNNQNGSNNKSISTGSSRQSCFVYLAYVIYESIIEDVWKVMKIENDDLLKSEKNNSIRMSDRFLSIQIILSMLKRYRRFVKISFENDKVLKKIIHRAFYDGLILHLQNSISPNNYNLVLFMLSAWIASFIDNRIIQIHSIFSLFNDGKLINCINSSNCGGFSIGIQGKPQLQKKSTLRVFSKFVFDWFNKFLVIRHLNYQELNEIEEIISNGILIIEKIIESKDFSKICNILINNIINSVSLIKLLPNFEVIISLYKDRLCKRLLNINMLGANPNLTNAREIACIGLQVCLEHFVLLCLEKSRGVDGDFNYLGGEAGINDLLSAIENDRSCWMETFPGNLSVEGYENEKANKSYLNDDRIVGDSMNVSLNSLRSLLEDFLRSMFSRRKINHEFQVFLTSSFNWRKMNNYVLTPVVMSRSSFDNEISQKTNSVEFFYGYCNNKDYKDVNIPEKIKKEISRFESEYKKEFPHRKINWLWENGFVVLEAKGFKAKVLINKKEVIGELVNFTVISSLSVSIILLKMGEFKEGQEITLGDLVDYTCLPMIEVARVLLSLSLSSQKLVKIFDQNNDHSKVEIQITKEKIIHWNSWLNKDTIFVLSDVIIQNCEDFTIFNQKIQLCPKLLSKELFLQRGPCHDYYIKSIHFKELFQDTEFIHNHEFFQIPNFNNCFRKIYLVQYPWNANFILDNNKYEDYFNYMSNIIGSDDLFLSIIHYDNTNNHDDKSDIVSNCQDFNEHCDSFENYQFKTSSFIYRDNFGILFNESHKLENYNQSMVLKNYKDSLENQNCNTFTSVIIDNENSLKSLLNQVDLSTIMKTGASFCSHNQLKTNNNHNFDSKHESDGNPNKKRCISNNFDYCSHSTCNDIKPKISSNGSNFSVSSSSSSSSSLIYMDHSINGQLLNGYFSGMIDIVCKIESIIIRILKKSKQKNYNEILDFLQKNWNHSLEHFPPISSIDLALIKLIKRDFIKFICKHTNQQCNCNEINQNILSYNEVNSDHPKIFSQNSVFEYVN